MSAPSRQRPGQGPPGPSAGARPWTVWGWWLLDAVLVVVFAATGRASHAESNALTEVVRTAWPFLVGLSLGWIAIAALRHRPPLSVSDGTWVWLATVAGGMLLRAVTGSGVAFSFILVALGVTGVGLLGWRWLLARREVAAPG